MKSVIIGDIHQHINYPKSIVDKEVADEYVFVGDWFDSFNPEYSVTDTAKYMMKLFFSALNTIFITGNHDINYYEVLPVCRYFKTPKNRLYHCTGYSNSKAKKISNVITEEFISQCQLVYHTNGYLVSHGGILPHLMPYIPDVDDEKILDVFITQCRDAWKKFRSPDTSTKALLKSGSSRGGIGKPGVTWCDWNEDFYDCLPWPQIVGHTPGRTVRFKGRSLCIDNNMGFYLVVEDEEVSIKKIPMND